MQLFGAESLKENFDTSIQISFPCNLLQFPNQILMEFKKVHLQKCNNIFILFSTIFYGKKCAL